MNNHAPDTAVHVTDQPPESNDTEAAKKLATLVYALQAISFLLALTFIAAVI